MNGALTWSELGLGLAVVLLAGWASVLLERNRRLRSQVRVWRRRAFAERAVFGGRGWLGDDERHPC